ncbi:MAG: hypothetical protein ABIF82_00590 [Planctomycetota bacterium]
MRVRMKVLAAGPKGVHQLGDVVGVKDETGAAWIKAGYAEAVPDLPRAPAPEEKKDDAWKPEAATIEPSEDAVQSPPRRRRRVTE